mgnify:CR=1 FL=1
MLPVLCVGEVWKRGGDLNVSDHVDLGFIDCSAVEDLTRVACFCSLTNDHSREKSYHLRGDRLPIDCF